MSRAADSTVRQLLQSAAMRLQGVSDEPLLDAQILLAHALGRDRSWLYAWPEQVPEPTRLSRFQELVDARAGGHPVAHLTGQREFWSLPLRVTEDTLIPRPETEQLVEIALTLALPERARVLDLGTGSGAIALALARERPAWQLSASDVSSAALAVARDNAARLGLSRIDFLAGDWFDAVDPSERFDLIISNLPYIAAGDRHLSQGDVRFEPERALVSGNDGLDAIRRLAGSAKNHLAQRGWLWLEHGYDQAEQVRRLLRQHGFADIDTRSDLAGHPRHSGARRAD